MARPGSSTSTVLTAIAVILFIAMGVGLIVSSVLWRKAVDDARIQRVNISHVVESIADPRVQALSANIVQVTGEFSSEIVVYPTFYTVTLSFSASIQTNNTDVATVAFVNVVPAAYPLPLPSLGPEFIATGLALNSATADVTPVFYGETTDRISLTLSWTPTTTDFYIVDAFVLTYTRATGET